MHFHCEWSSDTFWTQRKTRHTIQKCRTPVSPTTNIQKHITKSDKWFVPHLAASQPESVCTAAHWACLEGPGVLWSDIYGRLRVMQKMSDQTRDFEDVIVPAAATHPVPHVDSSLTIFCGLHSYSNLLHIITTYANATGQLPMQTNTTIFGRPYYRSSLWYSVSSVCRL